MRLHPHLPTPSRTFLALMLSAVASVNAMAEVAVPQDIAAPESEALPPKSPQVEIGVHRLNNDTYGVGGVTIEQENTAFRLVGDYSNQAEHIMLGGGIRLGERHHLVGGISVGSEPIPGRNARMKGYSGLLRLSGTQPIDGVRQWFIEGLHQRTQNRLLSVTDAAFDETTSDTQGLVTTLTHTRGVQRSTTRFYGGQRTEIAATVEANAGEEGVAALRFLHGETKLLGEKDRYNRVNVTYQRYMPEYDANWLIGVDNKGLLQLGAQKRLDSLDASLVVQAFRSTRSDRSYGLYVGLRFELGDVPSQPGKRPETNIALLRDAVHALYAPRNYFGTVLETEERLVTEVTTETHVAQRPAVVVPPAPPADEPPKPIDPPVTPDPDPAPTDIELNQTVTLDLDGRSDPDNPVLTLAGPIVAGRLSCSDIAVAPNTANTCTFSGGNGPIGVGPDGTVTYGPGGYTKGSFSIAVTAKDQVGNTYSKTLSLNFSSAVP